MKIKVNDKLTIKQCVKKPFIFLDICNTKNI